ncbi:uncharacterized protein LOC111032650, partial [Myzus persicae]|uniref:uncharacterized protein LOC111032650 n=1 Tax=Myzus persicae TaxID=13164 RepID=UPI000B93888E
LRQLEDLMSSKLTQSAHTQTESELSLSAVQDLDNKVDTKLSNYQRSLMEKIDDELKTIGCDVKSIKHCYGMLNTSFHEMENKLISLENNSEKPMRKYNDIKTRIAALERDVMKNSSQIIGLNYSLRSLEWTRPQSFGSPGMFPPDNRCYNEQASFAAAPSYYDMPPTAKPGPSGAVLPPSPPAPPSTSVFCQPLPPAPPAPLSQNIPKKSDSDKSSSSSTAKGEQVYGRIPITTEILKSIVLKPPGERKRVSKPFSAKVEEVSGRTPITAEMLKSVVLKPPGEKKKEPNKKPQNSGDKENKNGNWKSEISLGTWNVRTLYSTGAAHTVTQEIGRYKLKIVAFQEIRWQGTGSLDINNHTIF